jgi:plasmid stabilization system protein ParE
MPRGDKSKYSDKQKRQAEHIAEGYEDRGVSEKEAKSRGWATVNKESGGGEKAAVVGASLRAIARQGRAEADSRVLPRSNRY